jgi:hypothetical protein
MGWGQGNGTQKRLLFQDGSDGGMFAGQWETPVERERLVNFWEQCHPVVKRGWVLHTPAVACPLSSGLMCWELRGNNHTS